MQIQLKRRSRPERNPLSDTSLPPILQRVYAQRGIDHEQQLDRSVANIASPKLLKGIDQAVDLLADAVMQQANIIIVGDYDADGATSTATIIRGLRSMGAEQVDYFVPDRFLYGYGLTPEIVEALQPKSPDLIITVDNGISSVEGVAHARDLGIEVLITDHHLPGQTIPDASAILNPNQHGDEFPSKALAGVGVVFYLLLALRSELRDQGWFESKSINQPNLAELLDLVALGTVADVVPLDHNNQILVEQGLRRIRAGKCCVGIQALIEAAGRNLASTVATDLGFVVGPRINAAGRLEDMAQGIECLLTDQLTTARGVALKLDRLNRERKNIEQDIQQEAQKWLDQNELEADATKQGICVYQPGWHQGVVGIVASRLKERYHQPAVVFADTEDGELKGSARSIQGVHIRDVFDEIAALHPGLITKFGGHAMAAGLSLDEKNYAAFQEAYHEVLSRWLNDDLCQSVLYSDGELQQQEYNLDTAQILRTAGPWGQNFPAPLFDGVFEVIGHRIVGENHLKLTLMPEGSKQRIDAIAFNLDRFEWREDMTRLLLGFRLDVNEYNGTRSVQLMVEYLEEV